MNTKNVKLESILEIIETYKRLETRNLWNIRRLFEERFTGFKDNLEFLIDLKLAIINETDLIIYPIDVINLKNKISYCILKNRPLYKEYWAFLDKFFLDNNDNLIFSPKLDERIRYASVREFLCQIELIETTESGYIITDTENIALIYKSKFTLEQLKRLNDRKEIIGENAEKLVLDYEKDQLTLFPSIKEKVVIKQISSSNVTAGYDIESFDKNAALQNKFSKIFIEVKAVSPVNYKFYLSNNEMESAHQKKDRYYIYLVPMLKDDKKSLENIQIIQNPCTNLFMNKEWTQCIESISFRKEF